MAVLRPDRVYLPTGGLNSEAGGISIREKECIDIENLRITPDMLITKAGDRRIADNLPGGDPIIEQFTYKDAGAEEVLFGFSKNYVWKYAETSGSWVGAMECLTIDDCTSDTTWSTSETDVTASTPGVYGDGKILCTDTLSGDTAILVLASSTDVTDYTHFRMILVWHAESSSTLNSFTVSFRDSSDLEIESWTIDDADIATSYNDTTIVLSHAITLPGSNGGWADLKKITINPYVDAPGTAVYTLEDLHMANPLANDVTYWSVTDFIDQSEGLTMIAAGSSPTNPGQEESDGSTRALLYYDTTNEVFKPLITKERRTITNEDTGVNIPGTPGTATSSGSFDEYSVDADVWDGLVGEGLCIFYTLELGLIATASAVRIADVDGSGNAGYYLIPANEAIVGAGSNSWVREDGQGWSIEFDDVTDWDTLDIYVEYTYYRTIEFNPRFVMNFHNRLLFGSTYESNEYYPWRTRWSRVRYTDEWTTLDYEDSIQVDTTGITGWAMQGPFLIIHKEDSVIRGYHTQGEIPASAQTATTPFNFETVQEEGFYATRTLQTYNGVQYFLGKDDVYTWDGNTKFSITRNNVEGYYRVRDEIFNRLNSSKILNCLGAINEHHKQYWLGIVEAGQTYPTVFYVYDILRSVWTKYRYAPIVSIGQYRTAPTTAIQDLIGTIAEQNWIFLSTQPEGLITNPTLAFAAGDVRIVDEKLTTSGGYTDPDTDTWVPGSDIASYLITADFIASDLARPERITEAKLRAQGDSVTMSISVDQYTTENEFTNSQTIPLGSRMKTIDYHPDMVGKHSRYYLSFAKHVRIKWFQPFYIQHRLYSE